MFWNLLAETENQTGGNNYMIYVLLIAIVVVMVVFMFFSNRKGKQRQKEYQEQMEVLGPGNKVKTIGGICGIVAEVCDDNTVIIETGSEATGKSYVKMDKDCISQTDAKGPTQIAREQAEAARAAEKAAKKLGKKEDAPAGETPAEEEQKEQTEAPAQELSEPQDKE